MIFLLFLISCLFTNVCAQTGSYQDFCDLQSEPERISEIFDLEHLTIDSIFYAVSDRDSLWMDAYLPTNGSFQDDTLALPVVYLLHGGSGSRKRNIIEGLSEDFYTNGLLVFALDYRANQSLSTISIKGLSDSLAVSIRDVSAAIRRSDDLIVRYNSRNDKAFHAIPGDRYLYGVSWGGITASNYQLLDENELNGLSDLNNVDYAYVKPDESKLPVKGSICRTSGIIDEAYIESDDSLNLLMFHGTCDPNVPFYKASIDEINIIRNSNYQGYGEGDLFGSQFIYDRLKDKPGAYLAFYRFCGMGHSLTCYNDQIFFSSMQFIRELSCDESSDDRSSYAITVDHTQNIGGGQCCWADELETPWCTTIEQLWEHSWHSDEYCRLCAPELNQMEDGLIPDNGVMDMALWKEKQNGGLKVCSDYPFVFNCLDPISSKNDCEGYSLHSLLIYPNPFSTRFTVRVNAEKFGYYSFVVSDLSGRSILDQNRILLEGENLLEFSVPANLAPGAYIMQLPCRSELIIRN